MEWKLYLRDTNLLKSVKFPSVPISFRAIEDRKIKPSGHSTLAKFPCLGFFPFHLKTFQLLARKANIPSVGALLCPAHLPGGSPLSQHQGLGQLKGSDQTRAEESALDGGSHPWTFKETKSLSAGRHDSATGYSSPGLPWPPPPLHGTHSESNHRPRSISFGVTSFPKVMFR